ncbi:MAG: penicillin-binding protein activator [Patescibacteria group bacterium]
MKKTIWIIIFVAIILIGGFLFHDKNSNPTNGQLLKIGAALPLTGAVASFGDEFKRGAEVAQDELNQNGQVVQVVFEDTALDPKKAVDAVTKLVYSNNIQALFVSAYSEAAATYQITDQKNIPELVLWDSNPQLEAMGDKVFALGPWTPSSGEVTAEFVYSKGWKKAAIFGYVQEWSQAVSEAFKNKFVSIGGTITDSEFSTPGATDYRTELSKIIATNPDVVYMTTEDFLKGVKQLKDLGYKGIIITSDLLDNTQITENPGLFEGVYGSQTADPEVPETSHFADLYKKKFGEDPKKILYGAWGYDAVHILYKAYIDFPDKNITTGLYSMDTYNGASGSIKFDANGTSKTIPKMFVVKNGLITLIK